MFRTLLFHSLLLPQLVKTASNTGGYTRLVIVASEVHAWTDFNSTRIPGGKVLATLNDETWTNADKGMEARYLDTKPMNVLFTRALASRLPPHIACHCLSRQSRFMQERPPPALRRQKPIRSSTSPRSDDRGRCQSADLCCCRWRT